MSSASSSSARLSSRSAASPGPPWVAIIGGGIGGLTTALALLSNGIPCRVFEQASDFAEEGAGIQLSPNATRLLRRLGFEGRLRQIAVRPDSLEILDGASGRRIFRVPLGDACEARFGAPLCTMRRHALHRALREATAPGTVVTGSRLTSLEMAGERVGLSFDEGAAYEADVVVGADGLRSTVRGLLDDRPPVSSGKAVFRGVVAAAAGPAPLPSPSIRVWTGPDKHCIAYPVTGDGTVSFTAVVPSGDGGGDAAGSTRGLEELLGAYGGWHRDVMDLFRASRTRRRWELYDRPPIATWVSNRVALLGDAAHPMLPFLAQGANAAIEDAFILAGCLAESWPDEIRDSLHRYQALRVPRASRLQAEARARAGERPRPAGQRSPAPASGSYLDRQEWIFAYDAEGALPGPGVALLGSG